MGKVQNKYRGFRKQFDKTNVTKINLSENYFAVVNK